MYDTQERLRRAKQAALRLTRKRERQALRRLEALCAVLGLALTGALVCVSGKTPGAVQGAYGATLLTDRAGGYVLVAVISFAAAVALTVACMRLRGRSRPGKDEAPGGKRTPAADR